MKKLLYITLFLTLLIAIFTLTTTAATYGDLTYTVSNGEVTITSCSKSVTSVTVPEKISGYPVTSIAKGAFADCTSLEEIILPFVGKNLYATEHEGVFGYIFGYSTGYFFAPDGTTCQYINYDNFYNQYYYYYIPTSLKKVIITGGKIPENAFKNCSMITEIIGENVTSIGSYAFSDCTNLTIIAIPDSVTSIGSYAFYDCDSLTGIAIPDNVTSIGERAFDDCDNLTGIWAYKNNKNYSSDAYGFLYNKDKTTLICCPKGTVLGSYEIPDSVTSIGSYAFSGCTNLTSITIPDGVISIGSYAFYWCRNLTNVAISNSVTSIGDSAFYNTGYYNNSSNWENGVLYIGNHLIEAKTTLSCSYTVKEETKTIASNAFKNCESLTSIIIPDSVTSIGEMAFGDCPAIIYAYSGSCAETYATNNSISFIALESVKSIEITNVTKTEYYIDEEIDKSTLTVIATCYDESTNDISADITISPVSFTSIGKKDITVIYDGVSASFSVNISYRVYGDLYYRIVDESIKIAGCNDNITFVTIPAEINGYKVTGIDKGALKNCDSLAEITLPFIDTYVGYYFGASSYSYNADYVPSSLKKVTIRGGTQIPSNAFRNCESLIAIIIPDSVASIGSYVFYGCSSLEEITLPFVGNTKDGTSITHFGYIFGASSYSYNADYVPSSLKKVIITGDVNIPHRAFYNCSMLTHITISDRATNIGQSSFQNCTSLEELTIPCIDRYLGWYFGASTYYGNSYIYDSSYVPESLKKLVIAGGTSIPKKAFYSCQNIESITLPYDIASIGENAFYNTGYYKDASNWENDVLYLGNYLLASKPTISSYLEIKNGTTVIADGAFYNTGLSFVKFQGNAPTLGTTAFPSTTAGKFSILYNDGAKGFTTPTWNGYPCYPDIDYETEDLTVLDENNLNAQGIYFTLDDDLMTATVGDLTSDDNNSRYYGVGSGNVIIPDFVTKGGNTYTVSTIGQKAFYNCGVLISISLPDTVTSIGKEAFHGTPNNKEFIVSADNPAFVSLDGVIFNSTMTNLRYYPAGSKRSAYEIPDSVTSVTGGAFYGVSKLEEMTLSLENQTFQTLFDGVGNIPTRLKKVTLKGETVTDSAFYNCDTIQEVILTDSVKEVNYQAFENCDMLHVLHVGNGITHFGTDAFYGCASLDKIYISDLSAWCDITFGSSYYYGSYYSSNPFYNDADLYLNDEIVTDLIIPEGVEKISARAFYGTNLKSVTLPTTLRQVGNDAFYYCNEIEMVNIKDLTSWCLIDFKGETANPLYYASDLSCNGESVTAVNVSSEVTEISPYAFLGYEKLTSISFPDTITAIEDASFKDCTSLKVVELSKNATSIGENAFFGCSNLVKMVIPTSETNISISTTAIPEWTTIYGVTGSAVEAFANTNAYTFVPMGNSVYTIRYNANGGENAPANASKGIDMEYTISTAVPTKKHSTFVGWSTVKNGEAEYFAGDKYTDNASITLFAVWQEPKLIAHDLTASIGNEFTLPIVVENNPGIAGTELSITIPDGFELVKVEKGTALSSLTMTSGDNLTDSPYKIMWDGETADNSNGTIVTLIFRVAKAVSEGDYSINIAVSASDADMVDIEIPDISVKVTAKSYIPGDSNGDNTVNFKDVIVLRSLIVNGLDSMECNKDALDVNRDGVLNFKDVILIRQYIVGGYGVVLK